MIGQLAASIVRIFDTAGAVAGAGFLVSDRHVLTCAHVVVRALGMLDATTEMPEALLRLDFPLVARGAIQAARPVFFNGLDAITRQHSATTATTT